MLFVGYLPKSGILILQSLLHQVQYNNTDIVGMTGKSQIQNMNCPCLIAHIQHVLSLCLYIPVTFVPIRFCTVTPFSILRLNIC